MKHGDNILEGGKHQSDSLFFFLQIDFNHFLSLSWMFKKFLWRNYENSLKRSFRS